MKTNKNLSDLQKLVILSTSIGIVLIALSFISMIFNQPGWIIGVSLGTVIEIINIILLYKGSEHIGNELKSPLFLLYFFLRLLLIAISFILTAYLDFKLHLPVFKNSIWGVLIGLSPMEIVVLLVFSKKTKSLVEGDNK